MDLLGCCGCCVAVWMIGLCCVFLLQSAGLLAEALQGGVPSSLGQRSLYMVSINKNYNSIINIGSLSPVTSFLLSLHHKALLHNAKPDR